MEDKNLQLYLHLFNLNASLLYLAIAKALIIIFKFKAGIIINHKLCNSTRYMLLNLSFKLPFQLYFL